MLILSKSSNTSRNKTHGPSARATCVALGAAFIGAGSLNISSGVAMAQTPAATPAAGVQAADASGDAIPEIVVTARRRQEKLQEVPVAVSVISGAQAYEHNLNDLQDITSEVPTVDFRTGSSNKDRDIFIRGIGTITTSPGVEPSVSTVVDGVVLDRPGQATLELLDVDHIEVLRGPQGTLFGKNATAGVINIVTTTPTSDFHAYAEGSYFGGGDEFRLKGGVSGEIVQDKLVGLVSGVASGYDGNVTNLYNDTKINGYGRYGAHTKLIFTPSDDLTATFASDYLHSRDTVPTGVPVSSAQIAYPTDVVTNSAPFAASLAKSSIIPSANNVDINNNVNSSTNDDNGGAAVTVEDKIGDYTLTSITAYRKWQNIQLQDYDQLSQISAGLPQVEDHGYLLFSQVTEEARIASPKGDFFDYQAGVYYLHGVDNEVYQRGVQQLSGSSVISNSGVSTYGTTADNYSIFGEGNLNFTDSFKGIVGFRVVRDDLDYHFQRVATSPVAITGIQPSFASTGSTGDYGYADRLGLQYDFNSNINTYFTYSHGYTGPAYNVFFNMVASSTLALKPETSDSYEVGLKSRFLDGRVQANLAAYITNFNNYQANFTDVVGGALVTRLINAGQVSSRGVEADVTARPIEDLTLTGAIARTDARVDNFVCPPNAAISCNINGEPLPFAPDWKINLEANYIIPVTTALNVVLDTDYNWQSKVQYQLTETPDTIQGAYGIWDASVSLTDDDRQWKVSILVKNIANTHYSSYLAHGDLAGVMRWVPRDNDRYFGVDIRKDF